MAVKIQVKRGIESNIPNLSQGELGFTTDTNKVFVGDGLSNHEIITSNSTSLDSRYFTESELQDHAANASSGAKKIGVFDELAVSSATNVQDVLKDIDDDLATIDDEWVQDTVGAMVSGNTESGITVTYDDVNGKLNFSGSSINWLIKTSAYTLSNLDGILADTSGGAFSVTLPSSPSLGDTVHFYDYKNTWTTNNLTILRNGNNIDGTADDLVCDTCQHIILTYTDATVGWQISSEMLAYNGNVISEDTTDVSGADWVLDEDDMASDDDEKVPTQQSVKAYSDNTKMAKEDYLLSAGRIMNPLLHLPLKNGFNMPHGTGSVTFTRSTTGTYIDRYGVVQDAAVNEARFEKEGLLIEGASTNKATYSEELNNSVWAKVNCTISSNATTSPDGTTTADGIVGNTNNTSHRVEQTISTTSTSAVLSCFCKKGNKDWCRLFVTVLDSSSGSLMNAAASFNLEDGTISDEYYANGSIVECANGWYRCSISYEYTGSGTVDSVQIKLRSAEAGDDDTFAGDGSTVNTYFWGAQFEEMPFATSYIPTTTAAVTRAKDVCYVTYNNNIPDLLSPTTILADASQFSPAGSTSRYIWSVNATSPARRCKFIGTLLYMYYAPLSYIISTSLDTTEMTRYGYTCDGSTVTSYEGGESKGSHAYSESSADEGTTIYLGSFQTAAYQLYGHISNFRIYDVALTEAEMKIA